MLSSRQASRLFTIVAMCFSIGSPDLVLADGSNTTATTAQALLDQGLTRFRRSPYEGSSLGFHLLDGATGEVLASRDPERALAPASIVKAITTAATLHYYPPHHRFKTSLEAAGTVTSGGVLQGDLVIRGGGDPSLGSSRYDDIPTSVALLDAMAAAVHRAGIRRVSGDLVADESCFQVDPVPDGFSWVDIGNGYGTGTNGLCFLENIYWITFLPGAKVGDPAPILRTTPSLPDLIWTNEMKTGPVGSGDQGVIYGTPFTLRRWARGTVPAGEPEFSMKGSLPDPGHTLATLLKERLAAAGVEVGGACRSCQTPVSSPTRILWTYESPELARILQKLNKYSINLYAEMMLLHVGAANNRPTRDGGLETLEQFLKKLGVPVTGVRLYDGSGLSRSNTVTAQAMAKLSYAMQREPHFSAWHESLPAIGVDGDMKNRAKGSPLRGRIQAKTGFIGGPPIRSLAGFLEGKSGHRYCFGFLINHHGASYSQVDKDMEALLEQLYNAL